MDLYNNNLGRRLALEAKDSNRPAEEVIFEAMKSGQLQTRPFNIK